MALVGTSDTTQTSQGTQTSNPDFGDESSASNQMLAAGRQLGMAGAPLQLTGLYAALNNLRARASGSTAAIFPSIMSGLADLRDTYSQASQAISRRLGMSAGGRVKAQRGQLLAQAAGKYGRMLTDQQTNAFAGLTNTLANVQPTISGTARPPQVGATSNTSQGQTTSTKYNPFDMEQMGKMLGGALPGQIATVAGAFKPKPPAQGFETTFAGAGTPGATAQTFTPTYYPETQVPYDYGLEGF